MFTLGKRLLGVLLLVVAAAMPLGCGGSNESSREDRNVAVGGDKGVVVKSSDSGTEVKVGGDKGVVVDHSRDQKNDDR